MLNRAGVYTIKLIIMKRINLPCLRGSIGDWSFFSTVMKIKDIVEDNRIITVSESAELYTQRINNILQREINQKRINQIKSYLLDNPERFFSSIIVAIHNGNPIWSDFDIEAQFRIENELVNEDELHFIENKLGVLTLSGREEIFALDGQHRLMGIRAALAENSELAEEEIPLIFVVHRNDYKERTRRLFTVLNKYAEKPKEAELIILDEDDASAILTRRLLEEHYILSIENVISSTNSPSIPTTDSTSFTTIVMINRINKEILKHHNLNYTIRPTQEDLDLYFIEVSNFWDYLFSSFPNIDRWLNGSEIRFDNGDLFNRNNDTGGSLILRPIGQHLFAKIYNIFIANNELETLSDKINMIDFNLNGSICKYIYWKDKMLSKNEALKRDVFLFVLGKYHGNDIQNSISSLYSNFGIAYDNHIQPL